MSSGSLTDVGSWGQQHVYLLYGIGWCWCWVGLVAVWRERARLYRREVCLLRSCHTHSCIDPPLAIVSCATHPPGTCLFTTLTDPALAIAMSCRVTCMHLHILLPLLTRFSLGSNPNITLSSEPQLLFLFRLFSTLFQTFQTRNSYQLNGIESEVFRSLNRLILLQTNVILVRKKYCYWHRFTIFL